MNAAMPAKKRFSLDPSALPTLAEFLIELAKFRPRYLVVGGWAVMAHTQKLRDVEVEVLGRPPDEENLRVVARALAAFGAPSHICTADALRAAPAARFGGVVFGREPNRVDVLSKMELPFEEMDARHVEFDMQGLAIPVACADDLIALKRIAFADDKTRRTDRLDLAALEALTSPPRPAVNRNKSKKTRSRR